MHLVNDPAVWLKELLIDAGLSYDLASILSTTGLVLIVILLSWLSNVLAKSIILRIITRVVKRTTSSWDDIFLEQKVFTRLSHFAPALVIWFMAGWALKMYPSWLLSVQRLTYIYMVIAGTVVVISFIESWYRIYLTLPISRHRPIKGYVQLLKLIVGLVAVLVVVAVVFKKEVSTIVAGLGAMAAVLMLIFKDAILGLVASIQLSGNKMLKVGDWITVPSHGVDGDVKDITLTTVKIQNFDKTIITIPAYTLVNESFQNWKGMEESGVRQIKRSIFIDMKSIRFASPELLVKLSGIPLLKEYFEPSEFQEMKNNPGKSKSAGIPFTDPNVTNLGLFRFYAESYLKNHPLIDKKQSLVVRHREPEGNGLPVQIYAFSNDNSWIPYENIQSEILEHLIAVLGEFELKIFQEPTGDDILSLSKTI
jgi:miniconductance mechanosensitive channel